MKIRSTVMLGAALLYGSIAVAQSDHKVEVTVDYSYVLPERWRRQSDVFPHPVHWSRGGV
jgi:hypothetical protein